LKIYVEDPVNDERDNLIQIYTTGMASRLKKTTQGNPLHLRRRQERDVLGQPTGPRRNDRRLVLAISEDPNGPTDLIPHPSEIGLMVFDNDGGYPQRYPGAIPIQLPSEHVMYVGGTQEGTYIKKDKDFTWTRRQLKRAFLAARAVGQAI
jgi:hypothetical protein